MWRAWRGVAAALFAATMIAACAQLPTEAKLKAFAQATSSASDIFKRTFDLNAELVDRYTEESEAARFIQTIKRCPRSDDCPPDSGRRGVLSSALPPQPASDQVLSEKSLQLRRKLIEAIGEYAKGLAEAADQGNVQKLEAAAITLASTVTTAVSPLVTGATAPIIGPASRLLGRGIGLAVGNAYSLEVRQIMLEAHPYLRDAVRELKHSLGNIYWLNGELYKGWQGKRWESLDSIRTDTLVTRSDAYSNYRNAVSEGRDIKVKLATLKNYERILDSMVKAHDGLISPDEDSDASLVIFINITKDLAGLVPALK